MAGVDEQDPFPKKSGEDPRPDPFANKARLVVRLVAGGFLLIGGLDLGLYLFKCSHDHLTVNLLQCAWLSIPLAIGAVMLVKTPALAAHIEDWLEQ